ncbi:DUF317 domain-containing protein [Kitasatospora sp. NPDC097605]|uniref:DUF317 domain-containing protein n=1 Tax=Kitasatospora sp. NPDC097605 TaxID=3157226 RepID=UPI00331D0CBF
MAFRSPDATAGLVRWDGGGFHDEPWGADHPAAVTLWARSTADQQGTAWQAHFSKNTPTRLITAALDHLTDPQPQARRLAEVPTAHLGTAKVRPYTGPVRPLAATRRTTLAGLPLVQGIAARRSAGRKT